MRPLLACLLLLALAVAGCADSPDPAPSDDEAGSMTDQPAGASGVPQTVEVMAMDNEFTPQQVTIRVGDTIRWVDHDNANPHNVVSDTPGQEFRSPDMDGLLPTYPKEYSRQFTKAGAIDYLCDKHSGMVGTILVEE